MAALDLVDWPAERTMRITGSPSSLYVPILLSNSSNTVLTGSEPALVELKDAAGQPLPVQSVSAVPTVAAGAMAPSRLRVRLDPSTPPGSYEGRIVVAGMARPLQIDVVEVVALAVRPNPLVIDLTAGLTQGAAISVENRGNASLTIDLAGDYPLGEELPLLAGAPEAAEGAEKLLALLQPARRAPPLREIGTIGIAMPEGVARVEPGGAATVVLALSLVEGLAATARFRAFIPLYDEDLVIVLVTAAKPRPSEPRSRPRSKGERR